MVKLIDENKTDAEVKSMTESQFSITLTDEQVARVVEARCIGYGGSLTPGAYITKGTKKADIAKLFLRMLASQDAANIYTKYGMMTSYEKATADGFTNEFSKGAVNVVSKAKYYCITTQRPGSLRQGTNLFLMPSFTAYMANEIAEDIGATNNVAERDYATLAGNAFNQVKKDVTSNWAVYMARAGKHDGNNYVL
jgi:ABC-type glycerol-3-phosphate transport system substrate-binding protein